MAWLRLLHGGLGACARETVVLHGRLAGWDGPIPSIGERQMRAQKATVAGLKKSAAVLALVMALGGCAAVDSAWFGESSESPESEQPATTSQAGTLPSSSAASPASTYTPYSTQSSMAGTLPTASSPSIAAGR